MNGPCEHCCNPDKSKWLSQCKYKGNWPSHRAFVLSTFDPPCACDAYGEGQRELARSKNRRMLWIVTGLLAIIGAAFFLRAAFARDLDGRYAASPLKPWFDSLKSKNGPCCSDADGTALADVDWRSRDGHYQVRLEGEWFDVPNDALITEPNRAGRTMVWPFYLEGRPQIRCFMPGSMT